MSATRPAKTSPGTVHPATAPAHRSQSPGDELSPAAQRYHDIAVLICSNGQGTYKGELHNSGNYLSPAAQQYSDLGVRSSASTQRSYAADLRSYEAFCTQHQFTPYPADLTTLTGYLTALADKQKKLATIHHHLWSIQRWHRLNRLPSLAGIPALKRVLRGIAKKVGKQQRQAPAFTVEQLKNCIAQLNLDTASGLRDRAILLMGFAGAFRRSELAAINIEDLKYDGEVLIIRIGRSKTTQNGTGEEKVLYHAQNPLFCPITAYKEWLGQLQGRLQGPVFVSMSRGRTPGTGVPTLKRLSTESVNDLVHKHLGDFAENVPYTEHSLRASFITTAKLAGQNHDFIRNQTNHKSDITSPRYTSLTSAMKGNAVKALGL